MWWEVVASDSISSIPGGLRLGKGRSRDKGRTKVVNAMWDVWKARNELIFQGKHWCTVRVCKNTHEDWRAYWAAKGVFNEQSRATTSQIFIFRCLVPVQNEIKINFDLEWQKAGQET